MVVLKMFSISLIKIKIFTILSMVFMGLFSRMVLGFPWLSQSSTPAYRTNTQSYPFPASGARSSLRLMTGPRYTQKRRRNLKDGSYIDEELTHFETECENPHLDFICEVIEEDNNPFKTFPNHPGMN
jgi:hypothetical protein